MIIPSYFGRWRMLSAVTRILHHASVAKEKLRDDIFVQQQREWRAALSKPKVMAASMRPACTEARPSRDFHRYLAVLRYLILTHYGERQQSRPRYSLPPISRRSALAATAIMRMCSTDVCPTKSLWHGDTAQNRFVMQPVIASNALSCGKSRVPRAFWPGKERPRLMGVELWRCIQHSFVTSNKQHLDPRPIYQTKFSPDWLFT